MSTDYLCVTEVKSMRVKDSEECREALRSLCREDPYAFGFDSYDAMHGTDGYREFMESESVSDMLDHASWNCSDYDPETNTFQMHDCEDEEENRILYVTLAPFMLPGGSMVVHKEDNFTSFKLVFEFGKVYIIPGEIVFDERKKSELERR